MQSSQQYQELVDFFTGRALPTGPQHVNPFSVYLNLPGAVEMHLQQLDSKVEASHKSAALMLTEVKQWLGSRP